ncbi:MAG: YihA family ribosome biogenesis GTP-binding protein [Alphaproteobacteria bacterium]|jgi:GTP-binding protein|nr:YihA family ribosome biogenesis GTP-binding protein [Alphaproteobacteria bacterium]
MTPATNASADEQAEAARRLFAQECTFVRGAAQLPDLPEPELPEIAFAGRSNVGKSSLLNALTNRKSLARTSNTPGRTRELNFFDLAGRLMLVDLPGYGYARASKSEIARWNTTLRDYLRGRPNLQRLCLLIDSRHGIKAGDREMMELLDTSAVVYRVVLTKTDKPKAGELETLIKNVEKALKDHPAALPEPILTSARNGTGIAELRTDLAALANSA